MSLPSDFYKDNVHPLTLLWRKNPYIPGHSYISVNDQKEVKQSVRLYGCGIDYVFENMILFYFIDYFRHYNFIKRISLPLDAMLKISRQIQVTHNSIMSHAQLSMYMRGHMIHTPAKTCISLTIFKHTIQSPALL